jgi:hypothetical protein
VQTGLSWVHALNGTRFGELDLRDEGSFSLGEVASCDLEHRASWRGNRFRESLAGRGNSWFFHLVLV